MANPIFGSGEHRYQVVDGFFKRPGKWSYIDCVDVDVDKDDNVYVFNRSPRHAVMIFDKQGNFLDAWGEVGIQFSFPHGITVAPNGDIFTADNQDHTVRRWTKEGKLLLTIGRPYSHGPRQSGEPFNRPTNLTVASNDDYYVSDGYGNSHIHCFDPDGKYKFSWGGHGSGPGEFDCIHSVFVDTDDGDKVYAADRYNNRVQIFSKSGEFLAQWPDLILANSVRKGPDGNFYVAELGHRISVLDREGNLLARWGDTEGVELEDADDSFAGGPKSGSQRVVIEPGPGLFCAPHGISVDSQGSIYVAEVSESYVGLDRGNRNIQKFVRV